MVHITHDSWMAWATMASLIQLSFPAQKLVAHTIHFPLNFHFLSQFIVAMFAGLMACIVYRPFYHLATMHVCKTVGIYQNISYLRLFLHYERLLANNKLFVKAFILQYTYYCKQLVNEKEFSLSPHLNDSASYGELFDDQFVNVGCVVLESINYAIITSYINHTYILPFCDEVLTAIFILFSTWLYNYYYYYYKPADYITK